MLATQLVNDTVPSLKPNDKVERALQWMAEFKVSHLPVIANGNFLGIIAEADLIDIPAEHGLISDIESAFTHQYVNSNEHIYAIIDKIAHEGLSIVPVLDDSHRYLGLIASKHLIQFFANIIAIDKVGGVVILEMGVHDYSMAEIARIIEGENAHILSTFITSTPGTDRMELTLKVDVVHLDRIVASLERFNYNVISSFHPEDEGSLLDERYDALMNYLSI